MDLRTSISLARRLGSAVLIVLAGGLGQATAVSVDSQPPDIRLTPGGTSGVIDLASVFGGGDDTYEAESNPSDDSVVSIDLNGSQLTVTGEGAGTATVTVTGIDTATEPEDPAEASTSFTVIVNSAPTFTADPDSLTMTEDDDLDIVVNASPQSSGKRLLDSNQVEDADASDATIGIAITGGSGNGSWEYLNASFQWTPLPSVSSTSAFLLGPSNRLQYKGDRKNKETATLTYRLWDGTDGVALTTYASDPFPGGGSSAFSSGAKTSSIVVTAVQDPAEFANVVTPINGFDNASTSPFTGVEVNDVDRDPADLLTVEITVDPKTQGALAQGSSSTTVKFAETGVGTGVYRSSPSSGSGAAEADVEAALRDLVFLPVPNLVPVGEVSETKLSFTVTDNQPNSNADDTESITLKITSVNDPPVIKPGPATLFVFTRSSIQPFSAVDLSDVDVAVGGGRQLMNVTVVETEVAGAEGNWINKDGVKITSNTVTFNGVSIEQALAEIRGLVYEPTQNSLLAPKDVTLTLTVQDSSGGQASTSVLVTVATPRVTTSVRGVELDQELGDKSVKRIFENVEIIGTDVAAIQVAGVVASTSTNVLASPAAGSFFEDGDGGDQFTVSNNKLFFEGSASEATDAIRRLVFRPTPNHFSGPETVQFSIEIFKRTNPGVNPPAYSSVGVDSRTTVRVIPVNDLPTFIKFATLGEITDAESVAPFPRVEIGDLDERGKQEIVVTVELLSSLPAGTVTSVIGTLDDGAGGFEQDSMNPSLYRLPKTDPDSATDAIQGLVFTPTPDRLAPGRNETVTFRVVIDDDPDSEGNDLVVRNQVRVLVVSENDEPVVTAAPSGRRTVVNVPDGVLLFDSAFNLEDADVDDEITVTIRIDDPEKGELIDPAVPPLIVGAPVGSGVYQGTGSVDDVLLALQRVKFELDSAYPVPAGAAGIEVFFDVAIVDRLGLSQEFDFSILIRIDQIARVVTNTNDDGDGSLRMAISEAEPNDHIVFDLASEFEVSPVLTIALQSPLVIDKNLTITGPGTEKLILSGDRDGDGTPDVQIFQIGKLATETEEGEAAYLHLSYLTLARGSDVESEFGNGGAVSVGERSTLVADHVEFLDCYADQWGGAIDVFRGRIEVSHCLFANNRTGDSLGAGGGAVSFFSDRASSFINTTFSANTQGGASGAGGGALFLENVGPESPTPVRIEHCSFVGNHDAAGKGSAIRTNVFNLRAEVGNSLFADGDRNPLDPRGAGRIVSLGGNVADDDTVVILSQGGAPVAVTLLDQATDVRSANLVLDALADNGGQTRTHALPAGSPARDAGVSRPDIGTDQRDVWRGTAPDSGAYEADVFKRIVINEIQFDPANGNASWIEIVNPRDSESLNLAGKELWIQGVQKHTFGSRTLEIGTGMLVRDKDLVVAPDPPGGLPIEDASVDGLLDLGLTGGIVEIRNPAGTGPEAGAVLAAAAYLGRFEESGASGVEIRLDNQSVTRNCEFLGAFLPGTATPGTDGIGVPLLVGNAPPIAYGDAVETDENTGIEIDVLGNDFDADRTDTIQVDSLPETASSFGAALAIVPDAATGAAVSYDPLVSPILQALPVGSDVFDTFEYVILDYANGITANVDRVRDLVIDGKDADGNWIDPNLSPEDNLKLEEADEAANLLRATGEVIVHVLGVNDAPTPADDKPADQSYLATFENTVLTFPADDLLMNDTDPDNGESGVQGVDNDIAEVPTDDRLDVGAAGQLRICWVKPFGFDIGDKDPTRVLLSDLETTSELGAHVKLTLRANRANSEISYDPTGSAILNALSQGEMVEDRFTYLVIDPHGAPGIATVCIKVTGVNDAPVANDDGLFATEEETVLEIADAAVLANDSDVDQDGRVGVGGAMRDDVLLVDSVDGVSALGATVAFANGIITYNPNSSSVLNALSKKEVIIDTFEYTIIDAVKDESDSILPDDVKRLTSTATISVRVTGVNDAPVARKDVYEGDRSAKEDEGVSYEKEIGVLYNTSPFGPDVDDDMDFVIDPDTGDVSAKLPNDVLRALPDGVYTKESESVITTDLGAKVTLNANGSFDYDPMGLFEGLGLGQTLIDTFDYMATDDSLVYANGDSFQVSAGEVAVFLDVLRNDVNLAHPDPNDDCPLVKSVDPPSAGGTASVAPDGLGVLYTPAFGFVGTETFTYHIKDGPNGFCMAEVVIEVLPASGPLAGKPDYYQVAPNGTADLDVLANDLYLPASTPLAIQSLTAPSMGGSVSIVLVAGRTVARYTPLAGFIGTETFEYTATAGGGTSFGATVTVTVPNRAGKLRPQSDTFLVVIDSGENVLSVLANDGVLPANASTWTVDPAGLGVPANGTAVPSADGKSILYTPADGFDGTETFTYAVMDPYGGTGTSSVTVVMISEGLVAADDTFAVNWNSANNTLPVLANDELIPDTGEKIEITFVEPPGKGTVAWNASRSALVYTPDAGESGVDSFSYEIGAASHPRQAATVTVNIINRSGELAASDDMYCVGGNSRRNALRVLANDALPPLGTAALTVAGTYPATTTQGGTLELGNGNALLFYTPASDFIGTDTFTYAFTDGRGGTGSASVTVKVGSIFVGDDVFTVLSKTTNNHLDVLANDARIPGGAPMLVAPTAGSLPDGVSLNTDGTAFVYSPPSALDSGGVITFSYLVKDDTGETYEGNVVVRVVENGSDRATANVMITVKGANDAPTIAGIQPIDFLRDDDVAKPFAEVLIGDVDGYEMLPNGAIVVGDAPAPLTVTVTVDPPESGELVNLVPGAPDFTEVEPGKYEFSGSPVDATTAIRELCFVPNEDWLDWATNETVTLELCVDDHVAAPVCSSGTTIQVYNIGEQYGDNWIFGNGCTLQWTERRVLSVGTKSPFGLPFGGGGTWSDPETGEWLLYTDGVTAWNADGNPVTGATGTLGGSPGETSSIPAIIVPKPGGNPLVNLYIFAFGAQNKNVHLTEIDLSIGANGAVVGTAGVPVAGSSPSQEGWAIVPHLNRIDYWLVMGNGNAYPVTALGVGAPVINFNLDGSGSSFRYALGGRRIAVGWAASKMNIYDFNPANGRFTGGKVELLRGDAFFEFSHDGTKLYVNDTKSNALYQYDLSADPGSAADSTVRSAAVQATEVLLHTYAAPDYAGDMALGPDGNIYIVGDGSNPPKLHLIEDPDLAGTDCGLALDAVVLPEGCQLRNGLYHGLRVDDELTDPSEIPPVFEAGIVAGVSNTGWTTVPLDRFYNDMVVVATPQYGPGAFPVIPRIRNATGDSFEIRLFKSDLLPNDPVSASVHYVVVEAGQYTIANDGIKMEAVRFDSTTTDRKGSWVGVSRTYQNTYVNPVVVGQVLTSNDLRPSVFWARGSSATNPPSPSALFVGKHFGEDTITSRVAEEIGYIVIEGGSGVIRNTSYSAFVGSDSIRGVGNNPPYNYSVTGIVDPIAAVGSMAAMDDNDGGWPVIFGSAPLSATSLPLAIDEDRFADDERSHSTEQVAVLMVGGNGSSSPLLSSAAAALDQWRKSHFTAEELAEPVSGTPIWSLAADADDDGQGNLQEYAFGFDPRVRDAGDVLRTWLEPSIVGAEPQLKVSFLRRTNDPLVRYELQQSTNLESWEPASARQSRVIPVSGTAYEMVVLGVDRSADAGTVFYRVKVTR